MNDLIRTVNSIKKTLFQQFKICCLLNSNENLDHKIKFLFIQIVIASWIRQKMFNPEP